MIAPIKEKINALNLTASFYIKILRLLEMQNPQEVLGSEAIKRAEGERIFKLCKNL